MFYLQLIKIKIVGHGIFSNMINVHILNNVHILKQNWHIEICEIVVVDLYA